MKKEENEVNREMPAPGETFLGSVADAYASTFDDLSEFCFVFPNKRAGSFFLKELGSHSGELTLLSPEVMSVSDLMSRLSERDVDSRIDLLFRVYKIYCRLQGKRPSTGPQAIVDFDSFRSWGETMLSDFSEVDNYYVDADALFANVSDFHEISSNFLSDDQLEVLERYFGYRPQIDDVHRFWKHLVPPDSRSELKENFMDLWRMMAPVYHELNAELDGAELATAGGAARKALDNVKERGREILPWKKIVFVGFNALTSCEAMLFDELIRLSNSPADSTASLVDFYWDGTGPVLDSDAEPSAFLRLNRRNFPTPAWAEPFMKKSDVTGMPPQITVIGSPSNSYQTKIAGAKVGKFVEQVGPEGVRDARVAVVLPDEGLLLPLLYSLPDTLEQVNLTMGYSLKLTSVASFLYHLRRLHTRGSSDPTKGFYSEDLSLFLSHPFSHILFGTVTVKNINVMVRDEHLFNVSIDRIAEVSQEAARFLDLRPYGAGTEGTLRYIDDILMNVDAALAEAGGGVVKTRIDRSHIAVYRDALRRLWQSASEHGIEMSVAGVFYMVDKLLAGEHVTFEGEPLEGLQVMGLLETRALDFDALVILSLNDRIMPRKARARTMIPDALRHGYGMPFANYQETLFSYYFYRMISRSSRVTLLYDARVGEGMRSGGESRYLLQLKYLYGGDSLKYEKYQFLLSDSESAPVEVEKTGCVVGQLGEFLKEDSGRNLSASALKKYCECPVRFYYEVVANIKADPEPDGSIDPITQGNIVHGVMLDLYYPENQRKKYLDPGILVTPEKIADLRGRREHIKALVRHYINKEHFKRKDDTDRELVGQAREVAQLIEKQIDDILAYDSGIAPFELVGGEVGALVRYEFAPGRKVNMKYAIDRLDILDPSGCRQWRIVDYKTGTHGVEAGETEDIFNGSKEAKNIFQLLLYANLMNLDRGTDYPVRTVIYEVDKLRKKGERLPSIGKVSVADHKQINEEFLEGLNGMIEEIFDESVPFTPCDDEKHCGYCPVRDLCRHSMSEETRTDEAPGLPGSLEADS